MATGVECQHERDFGAYRRAHSQWRNEGMDALAVNEVPGLPRDDAGDFRGEVVVLVCGPGAYPPDRDLGDFFPRGELAAGVRREHGHVHASGGQSLSHLVHVRLDTTHKWEVAWGHE